MICIFNRFVLQIFVYHHIQARIKLKIFLAKQQSSKNVNYFLHTKQESSKTTIARKDSIKIKTRICTPTSVRSRISSKSSNQVRVGSWRTIYVIPKFAMQQLHTKKTRNYLLMKINHRTNSFISICPHPWPSVIKCTYTISIVHHTILLSCFVILFKI